MTANGQSAVEVNGNGPGFLASACAFCIQIAKLMSPRRETAVNKAQINL